MSQTKKIKILVAGDVDGKFGQLYSRVDTVMKKNEFDMLLCVGNFFGDSSDEWEAYLKGSKTVPISTYILGPCKPEYEKYFPNEGKELCPNIFYLGKNGVMTGSSGLKILYLSGCQNSSGKCSISPKEVEILISTLQDSKGIDIVLTSEWPSGISKYSTTPQSDSTIRESLLISKLVYFIKPRYHFASINDCFYERQPYRNHKVCAETYSHSTRFIALAKVGNSKKRKWLYAFNIEPMASMDRTELVRQPPDVTECPFSFTEADISVQPDSKQYFYDTSNPDSYDGRKRRYQDNDQSQKKTRTMGNCWFCLKSPDIDKHLILSIGTYNYLTLCKGGLIPDHILILPIDHTRSTLDMTDECLEEIQQYKKVLSKFYLTKNKVPVFFERNYKSPHLQIQVVALPKQLVSRIKEIFMDITDSMDLKVEEIPSYSDLAQMVGPNMPYFYFEFENTKLLHIIKNQFPLQFGREVLASTALLNMPDRIDYKNCAIGQEEETKLVTKFKRDFEPFDFTE